MQRALWIVVVACTLVAALALWPRDEAGPEHEPSAKARARAAAVRRDPEPVDQRALELAIREMLASAEAVDPAGLDAKVETALDPNAPLSERIRAVRWLARLGSDEALAALEELLALDHESALQAAIAEALGSSPHPQARGLLLELLQSSDETVLRGAIRGLAASGDPGAVEALRALLLDESSSSLVRAEAALALGEIGGAEALQVLLDGFEKLEGEDIIESILFGLSEYDFAETEAFFRSVLASTELSLELKVDALQALGDASPDAATLLLETAGRSTEPELRAAAIEALAMLDGQPLDNTALLALLPGETSPYVRQEIYSALAFAGPGDATAELRAILPRVLAEQTPRTRLEGSRLLAGLVRETGDADAQYSFDRELVPWLRDQALGAGGRYERLASIDALKLASTPESRGALLDLIRSPDPQTAAAAERALEFQDRLPPASAN